MPKIKVFFISAANSIHTVKWVNALCRDFEVHLIYCNNHTPGIHNINSKVILHKLPFNAPYGYYLNCSFLNHLFRQIKPDIVNVHFASGYGTLARISKIPVDLLSVWGSDVYAFPKKSKVKKKILEKNIEYANNIASTSNVMAKELKNVFPNLSKEIFITPFGVDINLFKPNYKIHSTINIGNIKSLEPIYAIDKGILAIKTLTENLINQKEFELAKKIRFYVYGDGSEKENLKKIIKEENLEKIVYLKGRIPNIKVPQVLNNLDIFCITSQKESFGVSVVEAMACEKPVVATNVDGFNEVMIKQKTGYIEEVNDINSIAEKLEILIKNSKLRQSMGKNGRKTVIKYYDWNKNVETMTNIYKKLYIESRHKNEIVKKRNIL